MRIKELGHGKNGVLEVPGWVGHFMRPYGLHAGLHASFNSSTCPWTLDLDAEEVRRRVYWSRSGGIPFLSLFFLFPVY